jgi:hypothetical protein
MAIPFSDGCKSRRVGNQMGLTRDFGGSFTENAGKGDGIARGFNLATREYFQA